MIPGRGMATNFVIDPGLDIENARGTEEIINP